MLPAFRRPRRREFAYVATTEARPRYACCSTRAAIFVGKDESRSVRHGPIGYSFAAIRHLREPDRHSLHRGRVELGFCRRGRDRARADRARYRHRGLGPGSGRVLRCCRVQAHPRTGRARAGSYPPAPSFDTVSVFTASCTDAAEVFDTLVEPDGARAAAASPWRIGVPQTLAWFGDDDARAPLRSGRRPARRARRRAARHRPVARFSRPARCSTAARSSPSATPRFGEFVLENPIRGRSRRSEARARCAPARCCRAVSRRCKNWRDCVLETARGMETTSTHVRRPDDRTPSDGRRCRRRTRSRPTTISARTRTS